MKKLVIMSCLLLVIGSASFAATPVILGGIRDGLAIGLGLESAIANNLTVRGAIEFNTGSQPIIIALGGKIPLTSIGRMPLSLGIGFAGYFGNNHTDTGLSLTFIFNRFLDVQPLFLEAGIDAAGNGRPVVQLGYKVY